MRKSYVVTFRGIEWDRGLPGEHPEHVNLPTDYTVRVEAESRAEALEQAGETMSDNTGFLFYGAAQVEVALDAPND